MSQTNKKGTINFKEMAKLYKKCAASCQFMDEFERQNNVDLDKLVPLGYLELPQRIPNLISVSQKNQKKLDFYKKNIETRQKKSRRASQEQKRESSQKTVEDQKA